MIDVEYHHYKNEIDLICQFLVKDWIMQL